MKSIWMGTRPERECTRVITTAGPGAERTLLKARLAPSPASRQALRALLEAVALWQGLPVRAALVVAPEGSCDTTLYRDCLPDFETPLYTIEYVHALRRPRRRDDITGMGPFEDLRQLLLFEVAR